MDTAELTSLPLTERLRAMEALWDSICRDAGDGFVSPAWHATVLDERAALLAAGEEPVSDWSDAKRRLRQAADKAR